MSSQVNAMNRSTLTLILAALAALALSAPAHAAFVPVEISALSVLPASMSGAAAAPMAPLLMTMPLSPLLPAVSLPSPSLPVNFPRNLPGVWNRVPVELPAEPAVPVPLPAYDEHQLHRSFLDDGVEVAYVAIPANRRPSARAQLAYAAEVISQEIEYAADALYDNAHVFVATIR
jgi:hypothetical protein